MQDEIRDRPKMLTVLPPNAWKLFEKRARDIVCDQAFHEKTKQREVVGFRFNPEIANWPVCRCAEAEGWAADLRQAMIRTLQQMMLHGEEPDPRRAVKMVLTAKSSGGGKTWEEATREHARRYALAKEWRARAVEECGSVERFIAVKRLSGSSVGAARAVRRGGASWSALSDVSLRMTGEHRE